MSRYLSIITLIAGLGVTGQELTLQEVMSYQFPTSLTASKTSGTVAWVENTEGVRNIYTATSPDYEAKKLTPYFDDDGQELGQMQFTDDNLSIVYVRGAAPNRSGEYPNPLSSPDGFKREIYVAALATGFPRLLAEGTEPVLKDSTVYYVAQGQIWSVTFDGEEAEQLFQVRGSVSSLRLSPDKSKLAFVSSRGDHAFIGVYDLNTGDLKFLDPSIDQDDEPVWSPDGTKVAFLRFPHEQPSIFVPRRTGLPFSIRVAEVSGDGSKVIWKADEGVGSAFRSISAGNQLLWTNSNYIVFPWEKSGWTQLWAVDENGRDLVHMTPGEFEVQFVSMSADRRDIYYSGNEGDIDRQHIWRVAPGISPTQLTDGEGVEWTPVVDRSRTIFFLGSDGVTPASVKRLDGANVRVTRDTEGYPSDQLVQPQQVTFQAADGMPINGQLFVPKDLGRNDRRPAVLFFHGGSRRQMLLGFHHRGYYHHAFALNQYLASQGYVVLSVNYRSGIGYGMEFREALDYGAGGASEYNDVLGAAQFLKDHPNVDGDRIGLWGGSYGGYLTALGLSRNSDIFKAGVDIHGVYDWNNVIKNFIPSYNKLEDPVFTKLAYDSSPIAFMDTWESPVLLIHGDDDRNVPFSETVDKAEALRRQGVEFEQVVFPDEVHGFLLHANWLKAYEATADFFDRMLR